MRLGIPRALHYYYHFPVYEKYLKEKYKCEILLSPETTREIVMRGLKLAPPETCLPMKVYIGHCAYLKEIVPTLFIFRMVRCLINNKGYYGCPKALGLPDLVRSIFPQMKVWEIEVDEEKRKETRGLGRITLPSVFLAKITERPKVMLIGHPYLLFDPGLNFDLGKRIEQMGFSVLTPFAQEFELETFLLNQEANRLPMREIAWFYEQHLLRAALLAKRFGAKGIILFYSFGCGTSAVTNEIINRTITQPAGIPVLHLMIDEHTQETGIETRLCAFLEILRRSF